MTLVKQMFVQRFIKLARTTVGLARAARIDDGRRIEGTRAAAVPSGRHNRRGCPGTDLVFSLALAAQALEGTIGRSNLPEICDVHQK